MRDAHACACGAGPGRRLAFAKRRQELEIVHTAKAINKALDREGRFWAKDYFDRFMRDGAQFEATLAYVEGQPGEGRAM